MSDDHSIAARRFLDFSINECKGSSPLYEHLSSKIAEDGELLELALHAKEGQPVPNLFLGAVQFLLLEGACPELKSFYTGQRSMDGVYPVFKDFCLNNSRSIRDILKTKLVQTNEVRRCGYLFPVFQSIFRKTGKPLALLEIGTSAGFQLIWDQYAYKYGGECYGKKDSPLCITAEIRGELEIARTIPPVGVRVGVDLHIVDVRNPQERQWMKALIWPEHRERREMFDQAADMMGSVPIQFIEGDASGLLNDVAASIPEEQTLCVFHTHVANQMSDQTKNLLLDDIKRIGLKRDVFHLYNNIQDRYLHLDSIMNGEEHNLTIAETDGHGRWFKWLAASEQ